MAIIDGDCNILLIKDPQLLRHCILLQKSDSESERKQIREFLTLNGNFDQLTVSNLIQFIPNCYSLEFENSKPHRSQRPVTPELPEGKVKFTIDDNLDFKLSPVALQ